MSEVSYLFFKQWRELLKSVKENDHYFYLQIVKWLPYLNILAFVVESDGFPLAQIDLLLFRQTF